MEYNHWYQRSDCDPDQTVPAHQHNTQHQIADRHAQVRQGEDLCSPDPFKITVEVALPTRNATTILRI